jgi:hypothetical protein
LSARFTKSEELGIGWVGGMQAQEMVTLKFFDLRFKLRPLQRYAAMGQEK